MSRDFETGSSQSLDSATVPVTDQPCTFSAWVKPESVGFLQTIVGIFDSGTANNFHLMSITGANGIAASSAAGGATATAVTAATVSAGVWAHACTTFGPTAGVDRVAYLNGGNRVQNTTNRVPTGVDRLSVGRNGGSGSGTFFDGLISHLAIWNVQLADGEIAGLGRGVHPLLVRPGSIVGYWPLWGISSPEQDYTRNGNDLTVTGATQAADEGPVSVLFGNIAVPYIVSAQRIFQQPCNHQNPGML